MRSGRSFNLLLLAVAALSAAACSDSNGPGGNIRPPGELNFLRVASTAPPLFNAVDSFYAKKGVDREVRIFFQDEVGGTGAEYLRLRIDAPTLLAHPDGTPFAVGDSVLITVRVVDPAIALFEMEPSGLTFNPVVPAELKIRYAEADHDFNEDGVLDGKDDQIETEIGIWRQETVGGNFERLGTLSIEELEELEADLLGFSRYAMAY